MHPESMELMQDFRDRYMAEIGSVLDVGGADVNGSYRDLFPAWGYVTLDHRDSDICVDGYEWPEIGPYDVVISGQCLEHDPRFWLTLQNMTRVLKPGGLLCLIVPSQGHIHGDENMDDCYRFLPDAMPAFAELMGVELLEQSQDGTKWGNVRGIFRKPE